MANWALFQRQKLTRKIQRNFTYSSLTSILKYVFLLEEAKFDTFFSTKSGVLSTARCDSSAEFKCSTAVEISTENHCIVYSLLFLINFFYYNHPPQLVMRTSMRYVILNKISSGIHFDNRNPSLSSFSTGI